MLIALRIDTATNRVIMKLSLSEIIDSERARMMRNIAGNAFNRQYAESLLNQKAANCKYSAVAAMFARLASLYETNPCNGLTKEEWTQACHHALELAGADSHQAAGATEELLEMNRGVNQKDLFRK